jgi:diguanylate cyclase (GGDEF)-like protein
VPPSPASQSARRPGLGGSLDALIYAFSVYGVPLLIGVATLVSVAAWHDRYAAVSGRPLTLAVVDDPGATLRPAEALRRLDAAPSAAYRETKLAETPFWFRFTVAPPGGDVELPSRHAVAVACWNATTLQLLGRADRVRAAGSMRTVKAGFAFDVGILHSPMPVLCRGTFAGPGRVTARQWPDEQLTASMLAFQRNAALLEGGLLVLSAFVLVTAIINREWLYVLFAAWLVASLRVGAISAGWDTEWLGHTIPQAWIFVARKYTIAIYILLTYALFTRLFDEDLRRVRAGWPLAVARGSGVVVLGGAVALPFSLFLPTLWVCVTAGVAALAWYLAIFLRERHSRVALWYAAALGIAIFSGLYEVIAAALGLRTLIGTLNSVTAALSSSLLAALAIAERMRVEHVERVRAEADLKVAYDAIPIGLFTLDRDGALERFNPALARMLGIDHGRAARRYWRDYFGAQSWGWLRDLLLLRQGGDQELPGPEIDGRRSWFHVKVAPAGQKIEGSLQDVTARREATERLQFLSENDPLTGVLNRRGVEKVIEAATQDAAAGAPLAVGYMDLDRFKLINELFGHVAGDDVLRQVCRRTEAELAPGTSLARIGGDEFVIVFRGAAIGAAAAVCRRIVEAIGATAFQTGDKAFQVKTSIGLVEVAGRLPVKDAITFAERACRTAKSGAHEGLVVYDRGAGVFGEWARERGLVERLGTGATPRGLFLMMQPILSLRAPHESLNFEILVRMRDADGSITPGGVLVATAEANGRAAVIDRWVLSNSLAWLERHYAALAATQFVTMNLSGASLNDEHFVHDAFAMLAGAPRATQRLCIEITEGVALHDLDNTRRFIERVRRYGAKVALDDFGAGYTSFSYLRELPADALKIDGSLIVDLNAHPANLAIVEAIVELARNLGMKSIAEWAEDCATVEALAAAGVDYVQGFAIARAQGTAAVLAARSSASFITDPDVLRFVHQRVSGGASFALPDAAARRLGTH